MRKPPPRKPLTPVLLKAVLLGFVLLLFTANRGIAETPKHLKVAIRHVLLRKSERVVGLEIHLTARALERLSNLPVGWYMELDNDASWQTSLRATARVGGAALNLEQLQQIGIGVTEEEFGDLHFTVTGEVFVTFDFEKERKVPLSSANFLLNTQR